MADKEPEIPESDDVPEDEDEEQEEPVADDEPHGHPHTPGYPDHRHAGSKISYDAGQVYEGGGLELFPEERHDGDSDQQASLEKERHELTSLTPLSDAFVKAAEGLGWDVERAEHPNSPGGEIFGLTKAGIDVSAVIALTE